MNPTSQQQSYPLTFAEVGQQVQVKSVLHRSTQCLLKKGLVIGDVIEILSKKASGSVMVAVEGRRLVIGAGIAHSLIVTDVEKVTTDEATLVAETKFSLARMSVGEVGKIISYTPQAKEYKGKLLSMGLTPGTEFKVIRIAPLGDPMAITVRGFHLSLRRQEAAGLLVESLGRENHD